MTCYILKIYSKALKIVNNMEYMDIKLFGNVLD